MEDGRYRDAGHSVEAVDLLSKYLVFKVEDHFG